MFHYLPKKKKNQQKFNIFRKDDFVLYNILNGTHCIYEAGEVQFTDVTPNVGYSATIYYIMHYTII